MTSQTPTHFSEAISGTLSQEDLARLGISEWRLSAEAEQKILEIEEHIAFSAARAKSILLD
jgi:hypothetical protein